MSPRKFKKARWKPGTVYGVPLSDGRFGIAQAVDAMMENVIYVALFSDIVDSPTESLPPLNRENVISLVATWKQSLSNGTWPFLTVKDLVVSKSDFPNERFSANGYIGAKHYEVGIVQKFLSAYHGLMAWNSMADEDYFDTLLAPGINRPENVILLTPEERRIYRNARL